MVDIAFEAEIGPYSWFTGEDVDSNIRLALVGELSYSVVDQETYNAKTSLDSYMKPALSMIPTFYPDGISQEQLGEIKEGLRQEYGLKGGAAGVVARSVDNAVHCAVVDGVDTYIGDLRKEMNSIRGEYMSFIFDVKAAAVDANVSIEEYIGSNPELKAFKEKHREKSDDLDERFAKACFEAYTDFKDSPEKLLTTLSDEFARVGLEERYGIKIELPARNMMFTPAFKDD